jgi:IS30 family transposase
MKQQQLDWRRNEVLELSSQGYSEREIADTIKVSDTTVHRDIQFLRREAQESLQKHIHEVVPSELQKSLTEINQVLKMAWSIVNKEIDNKTKLQALALINDCNKYKMDLATGSAICNQAIYPVAETGPDYLSTYFFLLVENIFLIIHTIFLIVFMIC